jgi:hypothetical protein
MRAHPPKTSGAILSSDTVPEVERLQVELWRRMSPEDKLRIVTEISRATQELSLAGIRRDHPDASERECLLRLAVRKLGREMAVRVYPEILSLPDP